MPQPDWGALQAELHDLAKRVAELERHAGLSAVSAVQPVHCGAAAEVPGLRPRTEAAVAIAIIGRALLGLAGAYLLRALTEGGALPVRVGVAVGIAYAIGWLAWAARTPVERRFEAAIHSLTAALVLAPLLWEATLHFHAVGTWTAAAVLLVFALAGMAVAWRKNLVMVSSIGTLASLATGAALLLATHDVLPFTFLFLAAAQAIEVSACLDHWLSERWLAALAADFAVLLATWLVTNERGLPEVYVAIPHAPLLAAQAALLAIYLSSTIVRTLYSGFTFTGFEMAQCAAAFAISVTGALRLSTADHRIAPAIAVFMLCCAAGCYLVSFLALDRDSRRRNFYTYSTFGLILAVVATRILLAGSAAVSLWSVLALGGLFAGGAYRSLTLEFHGGVYLLLALSAMQVPQRAASFLLGSAVWPGRDTWIFVTGALLAAAGYGLSTRWAPGRGAGWHLAVFRLVVAAACVWAVAGLAAGSLTGLYHGWLGDDATHAYCATLRTSVLAGLSVLLAWAGARWKRAELSWLIYPVMLAGGYRLLFYDLHQDRKAALFFSLLIYGAALTGLPKLKRSASSVEAS